MNKGYKKRYNSKNEDITRCVQKRAIFPHYLSFSNDVIISRIRAIYTAGYLYKEEGENKNLLYKHTHHS